MNDLIKQIEDKQNEMKEYDKITDKWMRCMLGCIAYIIIMSVFGRYFIEHIPVKLAVFLILMWLVMPFLALFYGTVFFIKAHKGINRQYELLDLMDEKNGRDS
jgi:hypothetical protein